MKQDNRWFVPFVCFLLICGVCFSALVSCAASVEPEYVISSSSYLYDPYDPHVQCAFAEYVFVGQIKEYLGGIRLDPWLDTRVGTLFKIENLENLKGDLEFGELALVKEGGLTRDGKTVYLCEEDDYFPAADCYCIFLATATNRQVLFSGAAGIDVIPLNVEDTPDREVLLNRIHQTIEYIHYSDGVADPIALDRVREEERFTSVFAKGAADTETRAAFFVPDWNRTDLCDLLPHEPVKPEMRSPEDDPALVSEMRTAVYREPSDTE